MNKIKFIHLLSNSTRLSLKEAKSIKDSIVNNEVIEILAEPEITQFLSTESKKYGVFSEIAD